MSDEKAHFSQNDDVGPPLFASACRHSRERKKNNAPMPPGGDVQPRPPSRPPRERDRPPRRKRPAGPEKHRHGLADDIESPWQNGIRVRLMFSSFFVVDVELLLRFVACFFFFFSRVCSALEDKMTGAEGLVGIETNKERGKSVFFCQNLNLSFVSVSERMRLRTRRWRRRRRLADESFFFPLLLPLST